MDHAFLLGDVCSETATAKEATIVNSGQTRLLRRLGLRSLTCSVRMNLLHARSVQEEIIATVGIGLLATLEWVSWFNHHRLLEPIGYIPPAEAEANYWRQQAQSIAADQARKAAPLQGVEP